MVLVDHRTHDRPNVEWLLALFVGAVGEDVADGGEVAGRMVVRVVANVALDRVGSLRAARETFSRSDIGVVVVREQNLTRRRKVGPPVLRLPIGSHHTVVTADAEVV